MRYKLHWITSLALMAWCQPLWAGQTVNVLPGGDLLVARNQAGVGGTLQLAAGTYNLSGNLQLLDGQSLIGTTKITPIPVVDVVKIDNQTFAVPSYSYAISDQTYIVRPNARAVNLAANVKIGGIYFPGSALWADYGSPVPGVSVTDCVFDVQTLEPGHSTMIEGNDLPRLRVQHCIFKDDARRLDTFIYFYNAAGGDIGWLDCVGAGDHVHIATAGQGTVGLKVHDIRSRGHNRNPVEYQGGGRDNRFYNLWSDAPAYSRPGDLMGFTLPADSSDGTTADCLVALATGQSNDRLYQRVMSEFSSRGFKLTRSLAYGVRKPVTITNPQTSGSVSDCWFWAGCPETSDTNGGKVRYSNTADASIRDALLRRGRPGPHVTLPELGPVGGVEPDANAGTASFAVTAVPVTIAEGVYGVDVTPINPPIGTDDVTITLVSASGEPVTSVTADFRAGQPIRLLAPEAWSLKAWATALSAAPAYAAIGVTPAVAVQASGSNGGATWPPILTNTTGSTDADEVRAAQLTQLRAWISKTLDSAKGLPLQ